MISLGTGSLVIVVTDIFGPHVSHVAWMHVLNYGM